MPLLIVGELAAQIARFYSANFGGLPHQLVGEPFAKIETKGLKRVFFFDVGQKIERELRLKLLHRVALKIVSRNQDAVWMFAAHLDADFRGGIDFSEVFHHIIFCGLRIPESRSLL